MAQPSSFTSARQSVHSRSPRLRLPVSDTVNLSDTFEQYFALARVGCSSLQRRVVFCLISAFRAVLSNNFAVRPSVRFCLLAVVGCGSQTRDCFSLWRDNSSCASLVAEFACTGA